MTDEFDVTFTTRRGKEPKPHKERHERLTDDQWEEYMYGLRQPEDHPWPLSIAVMLVLAWAIAMGAIVILYA